MLRLFKWIFVFGVAVCVLAGMAFFAWQHIPMHAGAPAVSVVVVPGASARQVANAMGAAQAQSATPAELNAQLWWLMLRSSGKSRSIKAGEYEVANGNTPADMLAKLLAGEQVLRQITFVEGWTFSQVLAALQKEKRLDQWIRRQTGENIQKSVMNKLGRPDQHPEGRFFPDTYAFTTGQSDIDVLSAAAAAMDKQLAAAWSKRSADSALQTPQDALVLASIVEKETGNPNDRAQISGVFHNRMRIGMRLQTDPTVIYGMSEAQGLPFDGDIRKRDLQTDTPYNTYTRTGLPPTPIAMPGKAALEAATMPERTTALYFVAKGDGNSHFSATLAEHNRAVDKYIRGR